jgi:hypothetical protein
VNDDDRRQNQLALIWKVLDRPDLNRGQRVVFLDMRIALSDKGAVLSDAQERWLLSVLERTLPDLTKVEAIQVPAPWRPMTPGTIALWVGSAVLALMLAQFCLTFLLRWFGWR